MLPDSLHAKTKSRLILSILPLFYVALSFIFLKNMREFYINGPDPVYAYLVNGTNLANGNMEIGHFDHPGTPIQCFAAAVIYLKHFIPGDFPVYQDVLLHPEEYLFACSIVLSLLLGLLTYFTGSYIFRNTSNIGIALLFQLTPLNRSLVTQSILLHPEAFIIIAGMFFMAYVYVNVLLPQQSAEKSTGIKAALVCGIFTGFLVASKITCAPFVILLLLALKKNKQRLVYIGSTILSFGVFIIPILFKLSSFFTWVNKLINHEGLYGKGKEGIINKQEFLHNLHIILTREFVFSSIYLLITIALVIAIISAVRKKPGSNLALRFTIGIWLTITILILLVAKHYAFRYLAPAQVCFPLAIIVAYNLISPLIKLPFYRKHETKIAYGISALYLMLLVPMGLEYSTDIRDHKTTIPATRSFLEKWKNTPVIITSEQGSIYKEPSLFFGITYAGNLRTPYFNFVKKHYTNVYLFRDEDSTLHFWDEVMAPQEIFRMNAKVLVYCKDSGRRYDTTILNYICTKNKVKLGNYKLVYTNPETLEDIYLISADTALAGNLLSYHTITYCNLERLTDDKLKFVASDERSLFEKANQLSHTEYYSGHNSLMANKKTPYGLDFDFPSKPGYFVKATVWVKNSLNKAYISIIGTDKSFHVDGQVVIGRDSNGWEQICCKAVIPQYYKGKKARFYVFYDGKDKAWFDDARIVVYPLEPFKSHDINCNMEKLSGDGSQFISADEQYRFQKAQQVSHMQHHSGKNSIRLDTARPYGMDLNIPVEPLDSISARVWRKSDDNNGNIVLSANNAKQFYAGGHIVINTGDSGWEQIQCTAKLRRNFADSTIKFYLYYPGKKEAWFDDLQIRVIQKPLAQASDILCDMEKTTKDSSNFISMDGHYQFEKGKLANHEVHYAGNSSIRMNQQNPFGLDLNLAVTPHDSIYVSIWRKSADNKGDIVLSAEDSKYFYVGKSEVIATAPGGWEKMQCYAKLPSGYKYNSLKFYLYYNGDKEAYFDNLEIKLFTRQ